MTVSYRARCQTTESGWAWDVASLRFYSGSAQVRPLRAIDSGNAGEGWGPRNAVGVENDEDAGSDDGPPWGGRGDSHDDFWIGGVFPPGMSRRITAVRVVEASLNHRATVPEGVVFEMREDGDSDCDWTPVVSVQSKDDPETRVEVQGEGEGAGTEKLRWEPTGPRPRDEELTAKPSRPLSGRVHGVCYEAGLHTRRAEGFSPDGAFYHAEDCEGLWVCASKACGEETLRRACRLVRAAVPAGQRRLWGQFRSPRWAKDPGPMRLIVLDDCANEQAGSIPELRDQSRGRNGTSCPFVFTSREDFHGGICGGDGWCEGQLTVHELTHGSDMVLRQLSDPYFHDEVGELWSKYREKFRFNRVPHRSITVYASGDFQVDEEGKHSYCYAAANRDEFLAECHCIAQGLHVKSKDYIRCNMSTPGELMEAMPDVFQLLERNFSLRSIDC